MQKYTKGRRAALRRSRKELRAHLVAQHQEQRRQDRQQRRRAGEQKTQDKDRLFGVTLKFTHDSSKGTR